MNILSSFTTFLGRVQIKVLKIHKLQLFVIYQLSSLLIATFKTFHLVLSTFAKTFFIHNSDITTSIVHPLVGQESSRVIKREREIEINLTIGRDRKRKTEKIERSLINFYCPSTKITLWFWSCRQLIFEDFCYVF